MNLQQSYQSLANQELLIIFEIQINKKHLNIFD